MQFTLASPSYETAMVDSQKPEGDANVKGYSKLDAATASNLGVLLVNQEKRYSTVMPGLMATPSGGNVISSGGSGSGIGGGSS
jgi:hypothetical protein